MRLPSHAGRALAAAALLAGFLALLHALHQRGLAGSALVMSRASIPTLYGVVAAAGVVCAFAPAAWRRAILLAAAVICAPLALGAWALAWFGYAAWVIAIARAPLHVAIKLVAALVGWAVIPVARIAWLDGAAQAATILLAIVWAGQLYSALYLVVEREREEPARRASVLADAFYLLAPPRLIVPFFQPISPRQLARSERPELPWPMLRRAVGLAAYAAVVSVLGWKLGGVARHLHHRPLIVAVRFCHFYAHVTTAIFTAVAMFRLLGFDLPSGFRTPFLSRSFAEFFRRFNYYVRDAVLSVFYYPLLGRLRHELSPRAATIVSAYVAIIAGSFLLHDLLVPMATAIEPASTIRYFVDPVRVIGMVALWTLIIVPTAGIAPRRAPPRSRLRTAVEIAAFNLVYFALWYAQDVGRGRL